MGHQAVKAFYAGEFSNRIFIRKYISRVNMQPFYSCIQILYPVNCGTPKWRHFAIITLFYGVTDSHFKRKSNSFFLLSFKILVSEKLRRKKNTMYSSKN